MRTTQTVEYPSSVRWRGVNLQLAKQMARNESRKLNDWLNLMVERAWKQQPSTEVIIHKAV